MREFLELVSRAEALGALRRALAAPRAPDPGRDIELVDVADCPGRYLASDAVADGDVPGFPRSTMDGYALAARDTFGASESLPALLDIVGECPMGSVPGVRVGPSQAARIWTGAMLPDGADAVVRVEDTVEVGGGMVGVRCAVAPGTNVVKPDEDVGAGRVLAAAGSRLSAADAGLLAACGITPVAVRRMPRIALVSTGCELVAPDESPPKGMVRDVNRITVAALVRAAGGDPWFAGAVRDEDTGGSRLFEVCAAALAVSDGLAISGGSSIGSRDATASVIAGLGEPGVLAHGVSVRPGRPTVVAAVGGKPVLGLPGHPVSAFVSAALFLGPAVAWLCGAEGWSLPRCPAVVSCNLPSEAGREDFVPARLLWGRPDGGADQERGSRGPSPAPSGRRQRDGLPVAEPIFAKSGMISGLACADGLVRVPPERNGISEGEVVEVYLLR